jgi:6-phospho-beta-glucosidase
MKLAVIGGGSTYTPELVDGFARLRDLLPIEELVLTDPDADRLALVGALAQRMFARTGHPGTVRYTESLVDAVSGADVVLLQLRVGGQAARLVDETVPLRCGCVGQETTGWGGLAKALRTVPVVLDIAETVAKHARPDAWIVDFTNPVGMVTQALLDDGHRALGLCNVAINVQRRMASLLGVDPDRVQLEQVGLNHLSWVRAVNVDGVDRLPELLASRGAEIANEMELPLDAFQRLGAIPSYYLKYFYTFDQVLAQQRNGHTRAEEVIDIEARLLEMYRDPTLDEKPALLADRGGAYYSEAAAQLLASLYDGRGDIQVVDLRNDGALGELADDDVVELSARIDREGAHPLPQRPLPAEMRELITQVKAYERLAISAARSGDRGVALEALRVNPLVGPHTDPVPLLAALLDANRRHLPRFF